MRTSLKNMACLLVAAVTLLTPFVANGANYTWKANTTSSILDGSSRGTDVVVMSIGSRREGQTLIGMSRLRIWSRDSRIPAILGFNQDAYNYVHANRAYVQLGGRPGYPVVTINGTSPHEDEFTGPADIPEVTYDLLNYAGLPGNIVKAIVNGFRASSGIYVTYPNTADARVEARGSRLPIELPSSYSWTNADSRVDNEKSGFSVWFSFHADAETQLTARGAVRYAVWRNMDSHNPTVYYIWSGEASRNIPFN